MWSNTLSWLQYCMYHYFTGIATNKNKKKENKNTKLQYNTCKKPISTYKSKHKSYGPKDSSKSSCSSQIMLGWGFGIYTRKYCGNETNKKTQDNNGCR